MPALLLWGPRPPPGGDQLSAAERAQQAVQAYRLKLLELAQGACWWHPGSFPQLQQALQAFTGRWLSAARAAYGTLREVLDTNIYTYKKRICLATLGYIYTAPVMVLEPGQAPVSWTWCVCGLSGHIWNVKQLQLGKACS